QLSGVKNYHVSVKETGGGIVFLRKVDPGAADRSYGIEVAKLAGLPNEVIERAREVLVEHESAEHQLTGQLANDQSRPAPAAQLTIFTPISQPVLVRLREVDLNRLTPLEALNLLAELKSPIYPLLRKNTGARDRKPQNIQAHSRVVDSRARGP